MHHLRFLERGQFFNSESIILIKIGNKIVIIPHVLRQFLCVLAIDREVVLDQSKVDRPVQGNRSKDPVSPGSNFLDSSNRLWPFLPLLINIYLHTKHQSKNHKSSVTLSLCNTYSNCVYKMQIKDSEPLPFFPQLKSDNQTSGSDVWLIDFFHKGSIHQMANLLSVI